MLCSQHKCTEEWIKSEKFYDGDDYPPIVIKLQTYMRVDNGPWMLDTPVYFGTGEAKEKFLLVFIPHPSFEEEVSRHVSTVLFQSAINLIAMQDSEWFKSTEVVPPSKLQKHRARLGRPPLFEFKLVELDSEAVHKIYTPRGGSHKPPKLHWRRGHLRRLSTERIVPVSPCLVGSILEGLTDKAYSVR